MIIAEYKCGYCGSTFKLSYFNSVDIPERNVGCTNCRTAGADVKLIKKIRDEKRESAYLEAYEKVYEKRKEEKKPSPLDELIEKCGEEDEKEQEKKYRKKFSMSNLEFPTSILMAKGCLLKTSLQLTGVNQSQRVNQLDQINEAVDILNEAKKQKENEIVEKAKEEKEKPIPYVKR